MLTNDREREVCEKHRARDKYGKVHCNDCPLNKGDFAHWDFRCKANSHYNRSKREWEYDDDMFGYE